MLNKLCVLLSIYKNDKISFVEESISSVINQTYQTFDIFILYDGPIDHSISEYIDHLILPNTINIFILKRNENKGLAKSLNELIKVAIDRNYQYIARMDADDVCMLDRFEKQINYLERNKAIDVLGSWTIEIDKLGNEIFQKEMPITSKECLHLFKKRDCLVHPSVMFRKSFFEKAGLYPEETFFGEDTMMWAKGFKNNCVFANIPLYLLYYRLDDDFFNRRRGWRHAKSIFVLRMKISKMLGFGFVGYFYAITFASIKLLPKNLLSFAYKKLRN